MAVFFLCAWIGLGAGLARADCPDPAMLVDRVEQAVLEARFEDAQRATDKAESAFGCTGSADSVLLARLWLAQGAQAHVEGDTRTRDRAFDSAAAQKFIATLVAQDEVLIWNLWAAALSVLLKGGSRPPGAFGAPPAAVASRPQCTRHAAFLGGQKLLGACTGAWRLAPDVWTDGFGTKLRQKWLEAAKLDQGSGKLDVEGLLSGQVVRVDGRPVTIPTPLQSGLYLVQAGGETPPVFAQIVLVPGDQTLVVRVDQDALQEAIGRAQAGSGSGSGSGSATVPAASHHRGRWAWFAAAGSSAALAGTSAILAKAATHDLQTASTGDQADRAYARHQTWSYASYGLAGLSALTIGLGMAW